VVVREAAGRLLESVDTTGGVRLLGVGVSGLADYTQEDLFAQARLEAGQAAAEPPEEAGQGPRPEGAGPTEPPEAHGPGVGDAASGEPAAADGRQWRAGQDVTHTEFGPGWVQGSGLGRVTVRFETPQSAPGRVRTFRAGDPGLRPADPLPLIPGPDPAEDPGEDPGAAAPGASAGVSREGRGAGQDSSSVPASSSLAEGFGASASRVPVPPPATRPNE
jgi:DNA polymerase-4